MFVINIENKGYTETWGTGSAAPYLATTLRAKGVLLNTYYGTAHNSQPNYVAQISGQGPNPQMQGDCQVFSDFVAAGTDSLGQLRGTGCVFPAGTPTLASQLDAKKLTWKGYMEQMGAPCVHPTLNSVDPTQKATPTANYAVRHNPFMYFHSIIDRPTYCRAHVVDFSALAKDLEAVSTTPNLSYITPDLCSDGHDAPCADGSAGGLASVNTFMRRVVPTILASPAYKKDGMLVITADESDGPQSDARPAAARARPPTRRCPGSSASGRPDRCPGDLEVDPRRHLVHHAVQPLLAARLDRGRLHHAVHRVRRTPKLTASASTSTTPAGGDEALRPGQLRC